ncbi:alanyl-tRNA editing protein [Sinanaerobacter sp. ZZT-01]|uniref:alanyl-tRNA editing protein n=1 Tax=Sinanaerobacter sp. ZZT-01 TaxID=3111540 RepID=UPI002D789FFD|nr:alanyl-tRNA editing protein [Sinanaerobacter sp. ZZT-01]WRR94530.1 alanyl-tRNA editing protein [Sinanaerobacter sp. ZZT-01]
MKTKRLYQKNTYLKECESTILEVITDLDKMKNLGAKEQQNTFCLVLDKTVFFPEGGGQPTDIGFINDYPVYYVFEKDDIVYHQLSSPSFHLAELSTLLAVGTTVKCQIDWNRRFLHMQMHCGEHILSGMFYQEYGGVNRGFHMGSDYMTIDINLEEKPEFTHLTEEMASHVEFLANKAIWSDVPVTVRHFQKKSDAEQLPLRKELEIEENISIVCVGSEENPADCVACCGTHPSTAGQVGIVKILKMENYKGMTRFTVIAGQLAYQHFSFEHKTLTTLCERFSSEPQLLLEKINAQEKKNQMFRKELYDLKKRIIDDEVQKIEALYDSLSTNVLFPPFKGNFSNPIMLQSYDCLNPDDLQTLGRHVTSFIKGLLILICPPEKTVLLFSNGKPDCGQLVRDNADIYQGKGGGNAVCARAIFTKSEDVETYVDLLEKHLR